MKWGVLFFALILLGLTFEFTEFWLDKEWGEVDLFFLIDAKMYPSSYIYYNNETSERIILALITWRLMLRIDSIKDFAHYAAVFAMVEGLDLIDFWATGNTMWFQFREYPVTFNAVKILIYLFYLTYEYARSLATS